MRYVIAKYTEYKNELAYRIYISDTLYYQSDNKRLTMRYSEMIAPKKVDKRTGDEVAQDIIKRLGLKTK